MTHQIIMAGFGGQGVMSMGKILAEAGLKEGKNVSWLPSYGPEMRGGTANCSVIISEEPVGAPTVTEATAAIVMNRPSLDKFEKDVIPGGNLFINSSLIDKKATRTDINVYYVPANEIANDMGSGKIANMVMLGAYLKVANAAKEDTIMEYISEVFSGKKASVVPLNKEALKRGADCIK
ncbi:2-oxoacid:acceptor oxidoreductase family protein [Lutispora sp.]|uniref:2-oxoacid:acceptor oxidoreductase family protein n=1 Tax=Lutispora sp. TaxID=2828727 RepID=UPI000EDF06D1|nr:2-oxoacid:acceptor oxidoreductase family protein [Lutispora sp.]MEA4961573.1 2-oxoacid:acceptor oxidoreductase family protein [Lutispora sp.]HCJ58004.1 2-oxoacid:ferredoxin oxidoreductase subunit gamma [Clostridiaceae bacterium]